jgi:hypothetical protein
MNVTIDNATLEGYKAFTKKEDLIVYSQIVIKTNEEGPIELLRYFKNNTDRADLEKIADSDSWKNYTLDMHDEIDLEFGEAKIECKVTEVAVKRNLKKQKSVYKITFETDMDPEQVSKMVIPYFHARVEDDEPEKPGKMPKGPKYKKQMCLATLSN